MEEAIKQVMEKLPQNNVQKKDRSVMIEALVKKDILKGKSREHVIRKLVNDEYNLGAYSEGRAVEIVRGVSTRLNKSAEELKLEAQEIIVSRFNDLYEKCYDKEEYTDCKDILKEMAKIFGINSGNKVEISKPNEIVTISFS